jgi:uncharacterized membrane protein YbhN (UPF0104 family)
VSATSKASPNRRRRLVVAVVWAAAIVGFIVFVVPQISGLGPTLARLRAGNAWWLAAGAAFEVVSLAAYAALFHIVFSSGEQPLGWRPSIQITLAGDLATKLFAAAGAGSVALTAWALRAFGLSAQTVARRLVCLEVLLYVIFVGAVMVAGLALQTGLANGPAPVGLTLIPAAIGALVMAVAASTLHASAPLQAWLKKRADRAGPRRRRWWSAAGSFAAALGDGIRAAVGVVKTRPAAPAAAVVYWALDIATLWASFRAFGDAPALAVLVLGYFLGALGNALPLPGGIGGVEGGTIGAFLAFGIHADIAVLAVLAYRAISYWLPTLPGLIAYVRLRGTVSGWRAAAPPPRTAA